MIAEITDQPTWNTFAASCHPNTFLHSWEWGQVQRMTGEDVQYLGISAGPSLIALALVVTVNARRGRHYLIPHGPLVRNGNNYQAVLTEIVEHLRKQPKRDKAVALRVAPLVETSAESRNLFTGLGFRPAPLHIHAELTWLLDITPNEETLLAGMRKTTRHAITKAERAGVTFAIVTEPTRALDRFWPLYEQTRQRHGFVLWPKKLLAAQLEIFGEGNHIFSVFARHNGQDVAAAILPHFGDTVFYYHGASIKVPGSPPAAQLLQWAAIREAKRRGAAEYNFWGIAPLPRSEGGASPKLWRRRAHPFSGITTFKTGFGGHAVDYLHAQDLPLSSGYWLLWAVDTFRKLKRGF